MSTLPWARYWTPKWAVGTLHGSLHHHCMNVWIGQLLWIALSSPGSYKLNKLLVSVSRANSKHVYYVIINSYCLINVNKPSVRVYKKLIICNLAIWVISTGVFDGFNNYKCSQTTVCCDHWELHVQRPWTPQCPCPHLFLRGSLFLFFFYLNDLHLHKLPRQLFSASVRFWLILFPSFVT